MTRPPATMPPRLCPHLRQKTESAAYTEPHLTHVDSTLQCYNAAIQSNWTQNQTNPSATSCWCWTVSKVLKASSSFGFFLAESKNEFVPILDWRMPMMTIQCIILHPSYMQLRCSESWVSLCKSFPSCWVPCFTAGTSNSTQGRPWLQTCKACVSGLSLSPFMIAKQIASFAAARKPLANEAIPNASINNVHK